MNGRFFFAAAFAMGVSIALPGCSKSSPSVPAGGGDKAAAAPYSGPLTDITQMTGTWIGTDLQESVTPIMQVTSDGKVTLRQFEDGKPVDSETDTARALGAGRLGLTPVTQSTTREVEQGEHDFGVVLNGPNLTISTGGQEHHFRRLGSGETLSEALGAK